MSTQQPTAGVTCTSLPLQNRLVNSHFLWLSDVDLSQPDCLVMLIARDRTPFFVTITRRLARTFIAFSIHISAAHTITKAIPIVRSYSFLADRKATSSSSYVRYDLAYGCATPGKVNYDKEVEACYDKLDRDMRTSWILAHSRT